ncbi:MAG: CCA tRNA nucleotidyltransferase [Candidatus Omnitrophota bacterium]
MKKQLTQEINKNVTPIIKALLKKIGRIADVHKVRVFLVGGFVRDLLLVRNNYDLDFVVESDAIEFSRIMAKELKADLKIHKRFKTAKLSLTNGLIFDVATARTECYKSPASLPVVTPSSLNKDLCRRDFSINSLAIALNKNNFGELIDLFQGQNDVKEKRIRVLHNLSFIEDPTRIFRAVRFEQRFDFKIDKPTENLIKTAVGLNMFGKLQKFRISEELVLLLNEPHPLKCIRRINDLCELKFIHPKIRFNKKMIYLLKAAKEIVAWYRVNCNFKQAECWIVYLLVILDGIDLTSAAQIFKTFSFRKYVQNCIFSAKQKWPQVFGIITDASTLTVSEITRILKSVPIEAVLFFMTKAAKLKRTEIFIKFFTVYDKIELDISGHDLKKISSVPGPKFKGVLEKILNAKIDGKLKTHADELNLARKLLCS